MMLYRANIAVLRAVPSRRDGGDSSIATWRQQSLEVVTYTFGINAQNLAEAVSLAAAAGQHAFNRRGEYIGGVVLEANARCADPREFESYDKYFHRPMGEPGIFYVSGTHSWNVPRTTVLGAVAELEAAVRQLDRYGLPAPSFTQPQLPEDPPTRVRLLCSLCGHWTEVDNNSVVFSFMPEARFFTTTSPQAMKSLEQASRFFRRHVLGCLHAGVGRGNGTVLGIQQSDARWTTLDNSKREDEDAQ